MARAFHPIRKRGNGWIVVDREGHTLGSHRTYHDALTQLRAIEVRTHGRAFKRNPPMYRMDHETREQMGEWAYENTHSEDEQEYVEELMMSFLESLDDDDAAHFLDKGWPRVLKEAENEYGESYDDQSHGRA